MTEIEISLDFIESPIEVEFYAIAGAPGRDGRDGEQGPKGDKGDPGETGPQGEKGETGEQGPKGDTGNVGPKGDKGDTGVQGPKGDKGDTGPQGPKGDKGDTGETGPQGVQGIQGIQGPKGDTGDTGPKGDKGDTGATGPAGQNGQDGHTPVKGTDYWTEEDKAEIVEEAAEAVDLSDYVKNTDYASVTDAGVVQVSSYYGTAIESGKNVATFRARSASIKAGLDNYCPIVPYIQHESTFYGLAKAAGDSTQSASSNTVGNYTDAAKIAIQKMLGIYQAPWELIREDTFTNATEANHVINADSNGQAFELTDIIMMFETPKQDTYAEKGTYGQIWFYYAPNDYIAVEPSAWTQNANTSAHGFMSIIEQKDNMVFAQFTSTSTPSNREAIYYRYGANFEGASQTLYYSSSVRIFDKIIIPKVTGTGHYKLYGKRRWQ